MSEKRNIVGLWAVHGDSK